MRSVVAPQILLPREKDWNKWAVVACDQFTSQSEYWDSLDRLIGTAPSTLRMILPELYLNGDLEEKAEEICAFMHAYLEENTFRTLQEGFVLIERSTPYCARRLGLVAAVDLEAYDYRAGTSPFIRATEGTIQSRIPPRLAIRKDAPIEFSHVMLLADDRDKTAIEPLYAKREHLEKLYDFELNMGGGHIRGWHVTQTDETLAAFDALSGRSAFLFAVGDGNHSLATAKAHWEGLKDSLSAAERETHPARFALVEIVNLYDEGIYFEPIHRYVTEIDRAAFVRFLRAEVRGTYRVATDQMEECHAEATLPESIRAVDAAIEAYLSVHGGKVDYVHGEEDLKQLVASRKDAVGILFEKMDKNELFPFVARYGALPKKTFSMGEAREKRYYIEGKRIR